jgi:hypothetical protein
MITKRTSSDYAEALVQNPCFRAFAKWGGLCTASGSGYPQSFGHSRAIARSGQCGREASADTVGSKRQGDPDNCRVNGVSGSCGRREGAPANRQTYSRTSVRARRMDSSAWSGKHVRPRPGDRSR